MKKAGFVGLATLLPVLAYVWISTAASSGEDRSSAMQASEYVYLHQTRGGGSALQKIADRSRLQCAAN
jgi:hypothetical protein